MRTILKTYNQLTEDFNPAQKIIVASLATFTALCLVSIIYKLLANFSDVQNASFGLIG